jgi:diguanylate cyclase (GGDEF)-like protein/PAS domain S-box-containing protein
MSGQPKLFVADGRPVQSANGRRADENLRESLGWFVKLFRASPVGVSITRLRDAVLIDVNDAWLDIMGYARDEVIGRTRSELNIWVDSLEREELYKALSEKKSMCNVEVRYRKKSGEHTIMFGGFEVIEVTGESYLVAISFDISERKRAEARIQYLATHDPLTGLPNRVLLADRLSHAIASAARQGGFVAVLFVDLDGFKAVNDNLGHLFGDRVLKAVASKLAQAVRESDTVARLGGDEFIVILEGLQHADEASAVARKIGHALVRPLKIERRVLKPACSIGISLYPAHGTEVDALLKCADSAMYKAKNKGGNRYQVFGSRSAGSASQFSAQAPHRSASSR